jgi:hypothetical protein
MQDSERVGRVLLESLHQAIDEVLPARLEYYERWLKPAEAPSPKLGAASFSAMLSFLHQEGAEADIVLDFAGQYAAVRSFNGLFALRRAFLRMLPRRLRARRATRLVVRVLAALHGESRVDMSRRRSTVFINIEGSPFCAAAPPAEPPTCRFYSTFILTFLQLFHLRAAVRVTRCRASGVPSCLFMVLADQPRQIGASEGAVLGLGDEFAGVTAGDSHVDLEQPAPEPIPAPEVLTATPAPEPATPVPAQEVLAVPETKIVSPSETVDAPRVAVPEAAPDETSEVDFLSEHGRDVEPRLSELDPLWDAMHKKPARRPDAAQVIEGLFSKSREHRDAESPWHDL